MPDGELPIEDYEGQMRKAIKSLEEADIDTSFFARLGFDEEKRSLIPKIDLNHHKYYGFEEFLLITPKGLFQIRLNINQARLRDKILDYISESAKKQKPLENFDIDFQNTIPVIFIDSRWDNVRKHPKPSYGGCKIVKLKPDEQISAAEQVMAEFRKKQHWAKNLSSQIVEVISNFEDNSEDQEKPKNGDDFQY
jgi:hypothetical protein